ncbi:hypothetical protein MNV49_003833 [Pseudohyphozyma bogoriensis]|nr:hypothetical protein MNV49_003833 [Pseudohyphozyma bogoriensis]
MPGRAPGQAFWHALRSVGAANTAPAFLKSTARVLKPSGAAHIPHHPPIPPAAVRSAFVDALHAHLGAVFRGVVRSSRPGYAQHSASRLAPRATPIQSSAFRPAARARRPPGVGAVYPPRASFGAPRVGLNTARNFSSSSRTVFENVFNNAPLGLRALGDRDRLDGRKWSAVRRDVGLGLRTAVKGKGKVTIPRFAGQNIKDEMATYFDDLPAVWSAPVADDTPVERPSVTLIIPLEPELSSCYDALNLTHSSSSTTHRILSPAVLQTIASLTTAYQDQANRLRAVCNALVRAGVEEDPNVSVECVRFEDGYREVRVVFREPWERRDVQQALGDWTEGKRWYSLVDHHEEGNRFEAPTVDLFSSETISFHEEVGGMVDLGESAPSFDFEEDHVTRYSSSSSDGGSSGVHDQVASQFFLPTISTTTDTDAQEFMSVISSPDPSHWDDMTETESWRGSESGSGLEDGEMEEGELEGSIVWEESEELYKEGVLEFLDECERRAREEAFAA